MSITVSYILYFFVILSSFLLAFVSDVLRKRSTLLIVKLIFLSAVFLPVLISSLRYGIGTDYYSYTDIYFNLFNQYTGVIDAYLNSRYEIGWITLNFLVNILFDNSQFVFVVSSSLIWIFSFKAIYDNKDKLSMGIAVLVLLCIFYNMSFNIVRQALAASVIMLSIKPLIDQKLVKYSLIIIIASTFHFTAIIMLPLYFVVNGKVKGLNLIKKYSVPLFFILFVIFIQPIFSFLTDFNFFSEYDSYKLDYRGFAKRDIILKLPIIVIILFNLKKLKQQNNPMYKLGLIFFLGVILSVLRSYAPYIDRVAIFFDISQVYIIAAIVKAQTNKYKKLLYVQIVFLYYIFWFSFNFLYLGRHETVPYEWILNM